MTMSRRRSLFVIGCLMAAFVAFASDAAFAQAPDSEMLTASARSYDTIRLTWQNAGGANLEKFSLRYQQTTPAADAVAETDFDSTKTIMRMDVAKTSSVEYSVTIDGLMHDKDYIFGLTPLGAGTETDGAEAFAHAKTHMADEPDDLMGLELMAGDRMIMAMWDEATDNGSPVTGYEVQYKMSDEADSKYKTSREGSMKNTSTEWTISNLMNDKEYTVRVRACSLNMCGDWSDEEDATPMAGAMPTPALPIFGAFALGVGLVAAGRRRLRRQRLLNS